MKVKGIQGNFLKEVALELGFGGQMRLEGLKVGLWEESVGVELLGQ